MGTPKKGTMGQNQRDRLTVRLKAMYDAWVEKYLEPELIRQTKVGAIRAQKAMNYNYWKTRLETQMKAQKTAKQYHEHIHNKLEKQLERAHKVSVKSGIYHDKMVDNINERIDDCKVNDDDFKIKHSSTWGGGSEVMSVLRIRFALVDTNYPSYKINKARQKVERYLKKLASTNDDCFSKYMRIIEDMQLAETIDEARKLMQYARILFIKNRF